MGVTFQRKPKLSKQCSGMKSWFIMAGCFPEFRHRTSSFDLHTLATANRLARIGKLFRSRSDDTMKVDSPKASPKGSPPNTPAETDSPKTSPKTSPKGSPSGPPRRRFMRVVRNNEKQGEEYVNPHVVRKYNQEFLQQEQSRLHKSRSLEEGDRPLPYTVTGHTILKKHPSLDIELSGTTSKPCDRHASFKEQVEIIAFDKKGYSEIMHDKLNDSEDEDFYSATSRDAGSDDTSDVTTPDPNDADLLDDVGDVFEECQEEFSRLEPIPETKPLELPPPRELSPSRTPGSIDIDAELSSSIDRVHLNSDDILVTDKDVARTFVDSTASLRVVPGVERQS